MVLIQESINRYINNQDCSQEINIYNLVSWQTSHQDKLIISFEEFSDKYGLDCSKIITRIRHHNLYITNGHFYFKYNSKLSFLQEYKASMQDILKLRDFYETFNKNHTYFWTITRKTFSLNNPIITLRNGRTKIEFSEINKAENNLRQLLWRLEQYGYHIEKYILVPEIKDNNGLFNYHYHMLLEAWPDIRKIRNNKEEKYRDLVYHPGYKKDLSYGGINTDVLREIWKDITKNESFIINPEKPKSHNGVFHYCLSYMNKGIKYESTKNIPYMYFALKSKKAYRVKGIKSIPKINFKAYTNEDCPILFNYLDIDYIKREDIPINEQEYKIKIYKNKQFIQEILRKETFRS